MKCFANLLVAACFLASPAHASKPDCFASLEPACVLKEQGRGSGWSDFIEHYPPDPVNVQTGNFFLPIQDLYLPCFGFPLELHRSYNSVGRKKSAFGLGWSFNYDVRISVSSRRGLSVLEADGFVNEYVPEEEEQGQEESIKRILAIRKKEDIRYDGKAKSASYYERLRKKMLRDKAYFYKQRKRYLGDKPGGKATGRYVSRKRGSSYLTKTANGYVRENEKGRKESYNKKGQMTSITDRNDNSLTFKYDRLSRLAVVRDACGRFLKFSYDSRGRIVMVTDSLQRQLSYTYDGKDRMASSKDIDGKITRYLYDKFNRMNKLVFADGAETRVIYDKKTGRVTRQEGPGKKVTDYTYRTRGKNYMRALVKDNQGGYGLYEYFPKEHKTVFTDKNGAKTITVVTACCGKPLSVTDEKGRGDFFTYDGQGRLINKRDSSGNVTTFDYESRFSQFRQITTPDQVSTSFRYDGRGNLTFLRNSRGEEVKVRYTKRGKIRNFSDQQGRTISFTYNDFGKPAQIVKSERRKKKLRRVGEINVQYQPTGAISDIGYKPEDADVIQDIRATLSSLLRMLKPSGLNVEI